jgi:adenylate cyclase
MWLRGYPDQALASIRDAPALAAELEHPYSHAFALDHASIVWQLRREAQDVYDHAEAAVTLSTEQGFPFWLAHSTVLRGWALMTLGQEEVGLTQMRQGLTDFRASGAKLMVTYFLTLLAEGYSSLNQVEEGLNTLKEGVEVMERTGDHWWKAEVHRLQGDLLLRQATSDVAQVESCFRQALEVARHQQAKSLELRSATSLARLWQQQNKCQEAHDPLAPVYNWFTEGFDTADLVEAKALLDRIGICIFRLS